MYIKSRNLPIEFIYNEDYHRECKKTFDYAQFRFHHAYNNFLDVFLNTIFNLYKGGNHKTNK